MLLKSLSFLMICLIVLVSFTPGVKAEKETAEEETEQTLTLMQWNDRILVVSAPGAKDKNFQEQISYYERSKAGSKDRDLELLELTSDTPEHFVYQKTRPALQKHIKTDEAFRQLYNIDPDKFTVLLIGLDGDEKKRWHDPVSMEEIFNMIDAMPMRQRELRLRNQDLNR